METKVTDVRIRKIEDQGNIKAFADITLNGVFVVHSVKLIKGERGYFASMPYRRLESGEYKDVAHPIDTGLRRHITEEIVKAYNGQ